MGVPETTSYQRDWSRRTIEHVLPKRSAEQFDKEGREQADLLNERIEPEFTVLDYGIGVGRVAKHIKAARVVGVDVSEKYLSMVPDGMETYLTNGTSIPLPDESVDFAYSLMVLQHCPLSDHATILAEIARCLKPGATAYVQFPDSESDYYQDGPFVNTYTPGQVLRFVPGNCTATVSRGRLAGYGDGATPYRELILTMIKTS